MPDVVEYVALAALAELHIVDAPVLYGLFFFAEHTLARAWDIGHDEVKGGGKGSEVGREIIADDARDGILLVEGHSCPLVHILGEDICALGHGLIAQQ